MMVTGTTAEAPAVFDPKGPRTFEKLQLAIVAIPPTLVVLGLARLLVQFRSIAWITNSLLLSFHLVTLLVFLLASIRTWKNTRLKETRSQQILAGKRQRYLTGSLLIFAAASAFVLSNHPLQYRYLATLATAISLVGAVLAQQFCWNHWKKRRRLERLISSGDCDAAFEILRPTIGRRNEPPVEMNNSDERESFVDSTVAVLPSPEQTATEQALGAGLLIKAAGANYRLRQYEIGYSQIEEALEREPGNVRARISQCLFLLAMNRQVEARHYWQELKQAHRLRLRALFGLRSWREKIQEIRSRLHDVDEF